MESLSRIMRVTISNYMVSNSKTAKGALLVGSIPLKDSDEVFRVSCRISTGVWRCSRMWNGPVSGVEVQTFITILIAAIYMILGLWTGYRLAVIGAILAVLVVSAFFYTPAQFPLMVSILGGVALILGGLWMRRVV